MKRALLFLVLAACACTPSAKTAPSEDRGELLRRLHLEYFPHGPFENASLAAAKLVELPGAGCKPDLENCGVLVTGDANDVVAQPTTCASAAPVDAAAVKGAAPILSRWRASLAKGGGEVVGGELTEVARLRLDDDDVVDRVLSVRFDVKPTPDNAYGLGPPHCTGLLLEMKGGAVAVTDDPCAAARTETFAQAFRLKGLAGVVLHVRTLEADANGAFLVSVGAGTVTRVELPVCAGNG